MSKPNPKSFHDSLDIESWKRTIREHETRGEHHWAREKLKSLVRALVEKMKLQPQRFNPLKQQRLVEREIRKGLVGMEKENGQAKAHRTQQTEVS